MKALLQRAARRKGAHAREFWMSRGGGFYGFAAALTFVYLEVVDLVGDVAGLGAVQLNLGFAIGWLVQNAVDALINVVRSTLWPIAWIDHFGLGLPSAALLAGAYGLYLLVRPLALRLLGGSPRQRRIR